jgi:hypothetical protein
MAVRTLLIAILAAGACAANASADGLPVLGIDVGSSGVTTASGSARIVTLPDGTGTTVARVARHGGRVLRFAHLPGTFTIPAVAYDGSASGLSADGRTLVLIQPRLSFPRASTTFAELDARGLGVRSVLTLHGDFSFDAISPHGRTMFLIHYTSSGDPTRYQVRAYDLALHRLLPQQILDPREHGDKMRGSPITRTTSSDGRWAYTLYDGAGGTPFVHALDTSTRRARCVDLPLLAGQSDLWSNRITLSGGGLTVGPLHGAARAVVDLRDFRVSVPSAAGGGTSRWPVGAAILAVLAVFGVLLANRHRHAWSDAHDEPVHDVVRESHTAV